MGSLIQARCADCGLDETIGVGGGFSSFTTVAAVPAGCDTCHGLVTVNAKLTPPYRCPTSRCSGSPTIIGDVAGPDDGPSGPIVFDWLIDDAAGTQYVLREGPHRCPVCGGPHLTFAMAGIWD